MPDLPRLIARCQQGDLDAFAILFDQYQDRLFDLACTILGDREAAKDAVQDTLLIVFQKIGGFRGEAAFETWLIAIVVNQCRQKLRYRKLRQTLSLENLTGRWLGKLASPAANPVTIVAKRQESQFLWEMVSRLDDRLRLPILLRYRYGFACDEIAEMLGLSINTIYEQLGQGRQALRRQRQQE
jgi:RNA polymerase sigma-70 factor (ECF subfamily)